VVNFGRVVDRRDIQVRIDNQLSSGDVAKTPAQRLPMGRPRKRRL